MSHELESASSHGHYRLASPVSPLNFSVYGIIFQIIGKDYYGAPEGVRGINLSDASTSEEHGSIGYLAPAV